MASRIDAYEVVEGSNDEVDKVSAESVGGRIEALGGGAGPGPELPALRLHPAPAPEGVSAPGPRGAHARSLTRGDPAAAAGGQPEDEGGEGQQGDSLLRPDLATPWLALWVPSARAPSWFSAAGSVRWWPEN